MVESTYVDPEVYPEFNLRVRVIDNTLELRDFYMFMLEHINEDFDDDLLQDTISLLVDEW